MTKHHLGMVNRPAPQRAGAPEIEITPAMMAAGTDAMWAWYESDGWPDVAPRLIYEAMEKARLGLVPPSLRSGRNTDKV